MAKQERAERTRQAVLLAAAHTFADAGFEAASLVDISSRAGVSKGALYFHFMSKHALADGVRVAAWRVIASALLRTRRDDGSGMQSLLNFAHELAGLLRDDIVVRAGVQLGHPGPGGLGAPYSGGDLMGVTWRGWTVMMRRQLDRASAAGELRPGLGGREAAELLTTVAAGLVLRSWVDPTVLGREAVGGVLTAVLPALVPSDRCADYRTEGPYPVDAPCPA
ncbi:ScbR family autoregulator-binding transcription factor [Kitasatospora sp. NBC_00315]|uniref:ScbR family autoregulator-binding transcription factor n=1 Tax=Kitasatospora sp. NBC_00315 TaxID=2975963 RepID=UPI0032553877